MENRGKRKDGPRRKPDARNSPESRERASETSSKRGQKRTSPKGASKRGPEGSSKWGSASASKRGPGSSPSTRTSKGSAKATPKDSPNGERLNLVISTAGIASRRGADELIAEGRVRVNGRVVTELGTRVLPSDDVTVDGNPVRRSIRKRYVLLNKPKDSITTVKDEYGRRTVIDVIGGKERLFPVGRLDRNTTGVLLLTNDGELANRMTHPRYEVERTYRVKLDRPLDLDDARRVAGGVPIGKGEESGPTFVSVNSRDRSEVEITLHEGKNREVRRIFEAVGYEVKKLSRINYGGLTTTGMGRGEWREMTRAEVRDLRSRLGLDPRGGKQ